MTRVVGWPRSLWLQLPRRVLQRRSIGTERGGPRSPPPRRATHHDGTPKFATSFGLGSDIQPGDYIRSWCKEYDISFPHQMKSLKVKFPKNPFKMNASFSDRHCLDVSSMKYFDKYEHPFSRTMFDIYIAKKKALLWYSAWSATGHPFVDKEAGRKVVHALREALASRGYDREGRNMASVDNIRAGLSGTLKVYIGEPQVVVNTKFAELVATVNPMVAELELRRGGDGKHPRPPMPFQKGKPGGQPPRDNFRDNRASMPFQKDKPGGHFSRDNLRDPRVSKPASGR